MVDLVTMKSYLYEPGGSGRGEPGSIPQTLETDSRQAHEELVELVAEGKDELMEEFFREGTIPEEHLVIGASRSHSRRQNLPCPVHQRIEERGDGSSAGLPEGLCSRSDRTGTDCSSRGHGRACRMEPMERPDSATAMRRKRW